MNRIEYLNLQTQVKNQFVWERNKYTILYFFRLTFLVGIACLFLLFIQQYKGYGIGNPTYFSFEDFLLFGFFFLVSFSLILLLVNWIVNGRERNTLEALDQAYANNIPLDKVMYMPEFEKFFPCLDLDLTGETKTKKEAI